MSAIFAMLLFYQRVAKFCSERESLWSDINCPKSASSCYPNSWTCHSLSSNYNLAFSQLRITSITSLPHHTNSPSSKPLFQSRCSTSPSFLSRSLLPSHRQQTCSPSSTSAHTTSITGPWDPLIPACKSCSPVVYLCQPLTPIPLQRRLRPRPHQSPRQHNHILRPHRHRGSWSRNLPQSPRPTHILGQTRGHHPTRVSQPANLQRNLVRSLRHRLRHDTWCR